MGLITFYDLKFFRTSDFLRIKVFQGFRLVIVESLFTSRPLRVESLLRLRGHVQAYMCSYIYIGVHLFVYVNKFKVLGPKAFDGKKLLWL